MNNFSLVQRQIHSHPSVFLNGTRKNKTIAAKVSKLHVGSKPQLRHYDQAARLLQKSQSATAAGVSKFRNC